MPAEQISMTPQEQARALVFAENLVRLGKRARRQGLLSLDSSETYQGLPFLGRLGLHLVLQGTDPADVRRVLTTFMVADGKQGWPFLRDWLSATALCALQGDRDWSGLIAHWSQLLGDEITEPLRAEFPPYAEEADESDEWDNELRECLTSMARLGQRLRCSDPERTALVPFVAWLVRASTRARRSGLQALASYADDPVVPRYLGACLSALIDDESDLEEVTRDLDAAIEADRHSGVSLLERMLARTWLSLLVAGTHPRIMFESLAGYFGEAYYPSLRAEMKRLGARKPAERPTAHTAPAATSSPETGDAAPPAGGSFLTQEEVNALLAPDIGEDAEKGTANQDGTPDSVSAVDEPSADSAAEYAGPSILSDDEVGALLDAVRDGEKQVDPVPLEGTAVEVAAMITRLFDTESDAGSLRAALCRTYALIAALLHPGTPRILDGIPAGLGLSVAGQLDSLRGRLPNPLEHVRQSLAQVLELPQAELPTQAVRWLAQLIDSMRAVRVDLLELLAEEEPDLFARMRKYRFEFEDLMRLDDQALQKVLAHVDRNDLVLALKTADSELQERVLRTLTEADSARLREQMELLGPIRLADAEAAAERIGGRVLEMEAAGDIVIARPGDEFETV